MSRTPAFRLDVWLWSKVSIARNFSAWVSIGKPHNIRDPIVCLSKRIVLAWVFLSCSKRVHNKTNTKLMDTTMTQT
jgi:hypothetical protein